MLTFLEKCWLWKWILKLHIGKLKFLVGHLVLFGRANNNQEEAMEIIGSSLAKATRIFPVMDCFQTHNRWGCSAKKWVSRENGGRESGVQKRLKGENNLGEKTARICLIDSMHTIFRWAIFAMLLFPGFFFSKLSFLLLILLSCKTRLLLWGHL